jgi:hypothetical protein
MLADSVKTARFNILQCGMTCEDGIRDSAEFWGLPFNVVWRAVFDSRLI